MPHTDGVVACKAICKLEEENKYEKCFKVIITGNTFFKSDEIDSKQIDMFMEKPFTLEKRYELFKKSQLKF